MAKVELRTASGVEPALQRPPTGDQWLRRVRRGCHQMLRSRPDVAGEGTVCRRDRQWQNVCWLQIALCVVPAQLEVAEADVLDLDQAASLRAPRMDDVLLGGIRQSELDVRLVNIVNLAPEVIDAGEVAVVVDDAPKSDPHVDHPLFGIAGPLLDDPDIQTRHLQ